MIEDESMGDGRRKQDVSLSDVHAGIVDVAGAMSELAAAITKNTKRSSLAQTVWLGLLTLGVAFLSLIAVANYQSIQNGQAVGDVIADCVNPGGGCYQRNQDAQAKAVAQVKADTNEAADRVLRQVECDAGIVCLPGFTPVQTGTTTTTTVVK